MAVVVVLAGLVGAAWGRQQAISYQNFRTGHGQGYPTFLSDGSWSQSFGGALPSHFGGGHGAHFGGSQGAHFGGSQGAHFGGAQYHHQPSFHHQPAFTPSITQHNFDLPIPPTDFQVGQHHPPNFDIPSHFDIPHTPSTFGTVPNPPIFDVPITPGPIYDDPQSYGPAPPVENYEPQEEPAVNDPHYQPSTLSEPGAETGAGESGLVPTTGPLTSPTQYSQSYENTAEQRDYSPENGGQPHHDQGPTSGYQEQGQLDYSPENGGASYRNEGTYQSHPSGGQSFQSEINRNPHYQDRGSPNPTLAGPAHSHNIQPGNSQQEYSSEYTRNDGPQETQPNTSGQGGAISYSPGIDRTPSQNKAYNRDSYESGYPSPDFRGQSYETDDRLPGYSSSERYSTENLGSSDRDQRPNSEYDRRSTGFESSKGRSTTSSNFDNRKRYNYEPRGDVKQTSQRSFERPDENLSTRDADYGSKEIKQRSLDGQKVRGGAALDGKRQSVEERRGGQRDEERGLKSAGEQERKGLKRTVFLEKKLAEEGEKLAPTQVSVEKAFVKTVPYLGESRLSEVRAPLHKPKRVVKAVRGKPTPPPTRTTTDH